MNFNLFVRLSSRLGTVPSQGGKVGLFERGMRQADQPCPSRGKELFGRTPAVDTELSGKSQHRTPPPPIEAE